jgi:hypothetical protein
MSFRNRFVNQEEMMKSMNPTRKPVAWTAGPAVIALVLFAAGNVAMAQVVNFVSFDAPGATRTRPLDVNNKGVIVGRFDDANGVHGFVLDDGVYTTVDYPGAGETVVMGINDSGQMVGRFKQGGVDHGFLLVNGVFTETDYPGAAITQCHGINRDGAIVGRYLSAKNAGQGGGQGKLHEHGFLMSNGVFTSVDFPNANTTDAWKITDRGNIVGDWSDNGALQSGSVHGYVLQDGHFTSHDVPGAVLSTSRDMSAGGQVVGFYWDNKFVDHGFLLDGGTYSGFDFPGAAWTDGDGINDRGLIVGSYGDSGGVEHGYFAMVDKN